MNFRQLVEVTRFGSNPGALACWLYLPAILAPRTPLVVVLHGCTQTAAGYDHGSGWTALADKKGFAVLFAEQRRSNNANLCFNWFEPADMRCGTGETLSIRQMIGHVTETHGIDEGKIFITGLSAGGAMANVMLAAYPELFAGGAIIGGLPYGMASGLGQALERMQGRNPPDARMLKAALATTVAGHAPLPRISIWHGTHDHTVKPLNAEHIAVQWRGVHGSSDEPDRVEHIGGHSRTVWSDRSGGDAVEIYLITGMAHGVPLSTGGSRAIGNVGPFMLDAGISSTMRIARSWMLADDVDVATAEGSAAAGTATRSQPDSMDAASARTGQFARPGTGGGTVDAVTDRAGRMIRDALKAAGLMR